MKLETLLKAYVKNKPELILTVSLIINGFGTIGDLVHINNQGAYK